MFERVKGVYDAHDQDLEFSQKRWEATSKKLAEFGISTIEILDLIEKCDSNSVNQRSFKGLIFHKLNKAMTVIFWRGVGEEVWASVVDDFEQIIDYANNNPRETWGNLAGLWEIKNL